ncbi:MAG: hypothetical protein KDD70_13225 [Bdellovibrionales bacterium]|nr:hypothetical protein [Bdellovibrionales bacterium]
MTRLSVLFTVFIVTILSFLSMPFGTEISFIGTPSAQAQSSRASSSKKAKQQVAKTRVQIKKAIIAAKKLFKQVRDDSESSSAALALINSLKLSLKNAKLVKAPATAKQLTQVYKSLAKQILLKVKSGDPITTGDISGFQNSADDADDSIEEGSASQRVVYRLSELPTAEDIFTTSPTSIPSSVSRLPNLNGLSSAFSVQQLFWESDSNFDSIAAGLTQQPQANQCLAFRQTTESTIAGYEACRSASAITGIITEIATGTYDACIAANVVSGETVGNGVTKTSGSVKVGSIFNSPSTTKFELSNGDDIFVQVQGSDSLNANITIWGCSATENSSTKSVTRYAAFTVDGTELSVEYQREHLTSTVSGELQFTLEEDEDGDLFPSGEVYVDINASTSDSVFTQSMSFAPTGRANVLEYIVRNSTQSEKRIVGSNFFSTGFDRFRLGEFASTYQYGAESAKTTGYDFGTKSFIVSSASASLTSGSLTQEFFSTAPSSPSLSFDEFSCDETADTVFTVDLSAESVSDAIATCTELPSATDFCSTDSEINAAATNFHSSCLN